MSQPPSFDGPTGQTDRLLDDVRFELVCLNLAVQALAAKESEPTTMPAPIINVSGPEMDLEPLLAALGTPSATTDLTPILEALSVLMARQDVQSDERIVQSITGLQKTITDLGMSMRAIAGSSMGGGGGVASLPILSIAPTADTNQAALAVRVVSQLGAGAGGAAAALSTAAKGTTVAGSPTSTAVDANTQALDTRVSNFPASQTVAGTVSVSNFPATQPVSIASTVPVSGTFWQTTQPVSLAANTPDVTDRAARLLGHVTVDSAPAVTGTVSVSNFPATQPVSLAVAPTTPVTGTFFQTTQPVSAVSLPLPAGAATQASLTDGTQRVGGTVAVTGAFFQATQPVSLADVIVTGSLASLNATVALALNSQSAGAAQITGTWVGTISFESTLDGTNWLPFNAVAAGTSGSVQSTTGNGIFRLTPAGLAQFRLNMTAFTSGSATITLRASSGTGGVFANQTLPVQSPAGTSLLVQGVAGGVAQPVSLAATVAVRQVDDFGNSFPALTESTGQQILNLSQPMANRIGLIAPDMAIQRMRQRGLVRRTWPCRQDSPAAIDLQRIGIDHHSAIACSNLHRQCRFARGGRPGNQHRQFARHLSQIQLHTRSTTPGSGAGPSAVSRRPTSG